MCGVAGVLNLRGEPSEAAPVAAEGAAPPAAGLTPATGAQPVCTFETRQFLECMTATSDNMDYCRGVFDQFKLCQANAATMQ